MNHNDEAYLCLNDKNFDCTGLQLEDFVLGFPIPSSLIFSVGSTVGSMGPRNSSMALLYIDKVKLSTLCQKKDT